MIRIALTGSIGMGKSTVARMFEQAGIPVFDADMVVRTLQGRDGALAGVIAERFPQAVRGGILDRERLASIALENPACLAELEQLIHPAVRDVRDAFVAKHHDAEVLVFEIPLLFETGGDADYDQVIVVSAPAAVQRKRVLNRPGMTETKLRSILKRQLPDEEKRRRAGFVVETGGDLSTTEAQIRDIIACLGLAAGG